MNPQQFAALALKFLNRTRFEPSERREYDAVEGVLQRVARGELLIGEPQKEPPVKKSKKS